MGNSPNIGRYDVAGYDFKTVDLNATVGSELTPLCIFVVRGNYQTQVQILSERGANFNVLDSLLNSPLHYAAERRSDLVKFLVDWGVPTCQQNKRGETPLLIAVKNEKYEYIHPLRDAMFIVDNEGKGPIHYAVENNDATMIQFLTANTPALPWYCITEPLDFHLNFFANGDGFTSLSLAVFNMKKTAILALAQHGADPDAKYQNKSPNDYIVEISRSMLYGTDSVPCTKNEILKVYAIVNKETDIYRNVQATSNLRTGLLSNTMKY
jgi:ankyrin repeat protein